MNTKPHVRPRAGLKPAQGLAETDLQALGKSGKGRDLLLLKRPLSRALYLFRTT